MSFNFLNAPKFSSSIQWDKCHGAISALVNLYQVQSVIVGRVPLQVGAVVEVAAAVVVVVVDDEAVTSKETVNKTFQLKHRVVQHSNVNLE